jgi:hypothetical protein
VSEIVGCLSPSIAGVGGQLVVEQVVVVGLAVTALGTDSSTPIRSTKLPESIRILKTAYGRLPPYTSSLPFCACR